MGKLYLEVITPSVIGKTLVNLSVDYIELNIVDDFSEDMTYRQFKELSAEIIEAVKKCAAANNINLGLSADNLEAIKKYAATNNINLGHKYNKSTDDVDKSQYQKYSTRVFVENGKYFNNVIIEYDSYFDTVDLNWSNFSYYDPEYKISFKRISKRISD